MPEPSLQNCRILVAEDEYMLMDELCSDLARAGARVIGPAASLSDVLLLLSSEEHLDGAVVDINLDGEKVFPAAEILQDRGVPFIFTTGYDAGSIPVRFATIIRCEKPVRAEALTRAIRQVMLA